MSDSIAIIMKQTTDFEFEDLVYLTLILRTCLPFYDLYDCIQKNYLQFVSWLFMMLIRYADFLFSV